METTNNVRIVIVEAVKGTDIERMKAIAVAAVKSEFGFDALFLFALNTHKDLFEALYGELSRKSIENGWKISRTAYPEQPKTFLKKVATKIIPGVGNFEAEFGLSITTRKATQSSNYLYKECISGKNETDNCKRAIVGKVVQISSENGPPQIISFYGAEMSKFDTRFNAEFLESEEEYLLRSLSGKKEFATGQNASAYVHQFLMGTIVGNVTTKKPKSSQAYYTRYDNEADHTNASELFYKRGDDGWIAIYYKQNSFGTKAGVSSEAHDFTFAYETITKDRRAQYPDVFNNSFGNVELGNQGRYSRLPVSGRSDDNFDRYTKPSAPPKLNSPPPVPSERPPYTNLPVKLTSLFDEEEADSFWS